MTLSDVVSVPAGVVSAAADVVSAFRRTYAA